MVWLSRHPKTLSIVYDYTEFYEVPLCREGLARRMQTVAAVAGVGYDMKNVLNMMMRRFYSSSSLIM